MKKEFRAESKRLLNLVINSIYTNKEIFLRELVSNASDATDKRYYSMLQEGGEGLNRSDLPIEIAVDKEKRTLSITDHGIGMTEEELEENLGTIAHSGSFDFKKDLEQTEEVDIIGQFGVGFYSAFMVSDTVEVLTRSIHEEQAYLWVSDGIEGYTVAKAEKTEPGSTIVLHLKENTEDENYDKYLEEYQLTSLITKHSDYIRYPIQMELEKRRPKEGEEGEFESYQEIDTINSMTPIWKKRKSEVKEEDYYAFYKEKYNDYQDPLTMIRTSGEGAVSYESLLFIPSHSPMNYYSSDYEKGLQLYASGVLVMEKCPALLPDYFGFVRGLVDSQDLSLNISREMLQQDRQLQAIASRLEKKVQSELLDMQKKKREDYEKLFASFGLSLKFGVYNNYGVHKESLQDLLMYRSSKAEGMTTLAEYVSRMPEEQEYIYYATGANLVQLENMPAAERVKDKGFEILYMTDDVDEFVAKTLMSYSEKTLRSIAEGDLGLETEEEKKELEEQNKGHEELFTFMKDSLEGKVSEVALSHRLKNHPVVISSKGEISLEMEKILSAMPNNQGVKAQRVLEINPDHSIFNKLTGLYESDKDKLAKYTQLLYGQALLVEGMELEDPIAFANALSEIMSE